MKAIFSFIRINDGKFQKGFLILSFVIFIVFIMLNGVELVNGINEKITSLSLVGDENAFIQNNKIDILKPISVGFPSTVIDYFLNDGRRSMRITALFYTLLTCAYLVNHASRVYIFSILTFCLIFLNNYTILYSATDDSSVMFFLVLGIHQFLVNNNKNIGLAALFLALITKDISVVYSAALFVSMFIVNRRLFFPIRRSLLYLAVLVLIVYNGGYNLFWKNKSSHQASNYTKGVSWFNVRAVSAIAAYNNVLKNHRVFPEEYLDVVKKLHIDVPNNQLEFFKSYPNEWMYDKLIKFKNVSTPHKVFSISILLILLCAIGDYFLSKSKNNEYFNLNFFLFLALMGMMLSVVGFFERRWIFAIEILFLIRMTSSFKKEKTSEYFLDMQSILYLLIYLIQLYMNRAVVFDQFENA